MKLADLDTVLSELGWNRTDLHKHIGVHRNTVSNWKQPPKLIMLYLRLLAANKRLGNPRG